MCSISAGFADTLASDIGMAFRGTCRHPILLSKVPFGINGGISISGTLASALGAMTIGFLLIPNIYQLLGCMGIGILGSYIDSLLGYFL